MALSALLVFGPAVVSALEQAIRLNHRHAAQQRDDLAPVKFEQADYRRIEAEQTARRSQA